jgi:hypothetical protein
MWRGVAVAELGELYLRRINFFCWNQNPAILVAGLNLIDF